MVGTNTYGIGLFERDCTKCSPIIYSGDFGKHQTMSDIAKRIVADRIFDKTCCENINYRNGVPDNE